MSDVVRAVTDAILAATPRTVRPIQVVEDGDHEPYADPYPDDKPYAVLEWEPAGATVALGREVVSVHWVRCVVGVEQVYVYVGYDLGDRPLLDPEADYPYGVPTGVMRGFDLCDPESFDKLRDWLTVHGVPTGPIGADADPIVAGKV